MKNTRKFAAFVASILAVACMAAPMATSFSADAAGEGSITITDTSGATSSAIKAYQIFTANVNGDNVTITGWGDGIDLTKLNTAIQADNDLKTAFNGVTIENTATSAQAVADVLSNSTNKANEKLIESFAQAAANSVKGDGHSAEGNTISNLDYGYYVAVDSEAASNGNYSAYSLGMLQVVSSTTAATINVKRDFPTFDKQIGDTNDSAATPTVTFNEAADHDINDNVPFKLIATVPSNIAKYDTYKMVFHDDLQNEVFTFNSNSVKVTYYASADDTTGTDVTSAFNVETSTVENDAKFTADGKKSDGTEDFTVTCNDIKAINAITGGVAAGGKFEVEYNATLTDKANLGSTGNWNGAYLEYSNNPNWTGTGESSPTDKSPVDYVVAFTYQTVIDKINGITNEPLSGAAFTLQKYKDDVTIDEYGTISGTRVGNAITVTLANDGSTFEFKGIDDGTYVLIESTVPGGYTGIKPLAFTLTAEETQTDGSEALNKLTVDDTDKFSIKNVYTLTSSEVDGTTVVTAEESANNVGAVYSKISNHKGSSLPSTGGIGTTIFYVAGGALVVGAGVLLVSKKRMSNK